MFFILIVAVLVNLFHIVAVVSLDYEYDYDCSFCSQYNRNLVNLVRKKSRVEFMFFSFTNISITDNYNKKLDWEDEFTLERMQIVKLK